jgi:hypothetical protein
MVLDIAKRGFTAGFWMDEPPVETRMILIIIIVSFTGAGCLI